MRELLAKQRKNKNKGFSLVELIVVVLIIAIIAVSLAPQVMKWVGTSKTNVDVSNMASIKSAVTTAVGEYIAEGNLAEANTITFNGPGGPSVTPSPTPIFANDAYKTEINEVMNGEWPKTSNIEDKFFVDISSTGKVTVSIITPAP